MQTELKCLSLSVASSSKYLNLSALGLYLACICSHKMQWFWAHSVVCDSMTYLHSSQCLFISCCSAAQHSLHKTVFTPRVVIFSYTANAVLPSNKQGWPWLQTPYLRPEHRPPQTTSSLASPTSKHCKMAAPLWNLFHWTASWHPFLSLDQTGGKLGRCEGSSTLTDLFIPHTHIVLGIPLSSSTVWVASSYFTEKKTKTT